MGSKSELHGVNVSANGADKPERMIGNELAVLITRNVPTTRCQNCVGFTLVQVSACGGRGFCRRPARDAESDNENEGKQINLVHSRRISAKKDPIGKSGDLPMG